MFAANWAVHDRRTRSLSHGSRRSNTHRAVNNRQRGPETLDVTGSYSNEILDLKRVADVQDIDLRDALKRG
jgi:hypothetical protein